MKVYKFLAAGATGPLSGFCWPVPRPGAPAAWVRAEGPLRLCANGTHVCRAAELAHWIHDELWETEIDGEQLEGIDCLVVRRARLIRPVDGWLGDGPRRFAETSARHAAELAAEAAPERAAAARALAEDALSAAREGFVSVSAFASALAVARLGEPSEQDGLYRRERAWQSAWIARVVLGA